MEGRQRRGSSGRHEFIVIAFVAALAAGLAGSFFVLGVGALNLTTVAGVLLVILGVSGIASVVLPRWFGGPDASRLRSELLEITEMLEDADAIPHEDQVLWEINRATEALNQGDIDRATEAIAAVRNLLSGN